MVWNDPVIKDCLSVAFNYLSSDDLLNVRVVCRLFNEVASDLLPKKALNALQPKDWHNPELNHEKRLFYLRIATQFAPKISVQNWDSVKNLPLYFGVDSHTEALDASQVNAYQLIHNVVTSREGEQQFEFAVNALSYLKQFTATPQFKEDLQQIILYALVHRNDEFCAFAKKNKCEVERALGYCFKAIPNRREYEVYLAGMNFKHFQIERLMRN